MNVNKLWYCKFFIKFANIQKMQYDLKGLTRSHMALLCLKAIKGHRRSNIDLFAKLYLAQAFINRLQKKLSELLIWLQPLLKFLWTTFALVLFFCTLMVALSIHFCNNKTNKNLFSLILTLFMCERFLNAFFL